MSLYHTPEWKALRRRLLVAQPICALCRMKRSSHVDHIRPHKGNWALFIDERNLQALCWSCHSAKTVSKDGGFGKRASERPLKGSGEDGMPTDPGHPWNSR